MTDQFSQEYIDYILSDEATGLQEFAGWNVGDWWTSETAGRKPYLLDEPLMDGIPVDDDVRWLPTLWDLVQIRVGKVRPPDNEVAEMASVLEWIASEALENAEPIMLAAAKLAVKASES